MSRYIKTLDTGRPPGEAQGIIAEYLEGEGFKYVDERGEMAWRKGFGALVNPQFIKAEETGAGIVHIEAWTAGVSLVPGVYGGELDPMHGVFGAGPKLALRPRILELERRLGGTAVASAAAAATPAGWFPDPTGRHEHRYWDGAQWTATVADAGTTTTDEAGAS